MEKYKKYKNNDNIIKERVVTHKVVEPSKALMKEIKRAQNEAVKDSVPLNFVKVDEKITTTVYKIPQDDAMKRKYNSSAKKCQNYNSPQGKHLINTINNDSIYRIKRRYNFQFEQFPTKEMGFRYYNQTQNNFHPNPIKSISNIHDSLKKCKSPPPLHASLFSTKMNSMNLLDSSRDNNEMLLLKNRCLSPSNSFKSLNLYNSLNLRNQLYNSERIKNEDNLNLSRIKHKKVVINKTEGNIKNNCVINSNKDMRTINLENNLFKSKRIYIDNNYNKPYYSTKNSYIIRSPTINGNKKMTFINDKNVGCPKIIYDYDRMRGGKIEKFLEKKKSNDEKYIIGTTLSKKVYDKMNNMNKEIEIFENDENGEENDIQFRVTKNFGDNYKYLERNEIKNPCKYEKTYHFRRSPVHVYGHQNYIIKDNKKIFVKTLPKGKIIRLYRNNDNSNNNCNRDIKNREVKTVKNKKFNRVTNSQQFHMTFPAKFKKEEFKYYAMK